MKNCAKTSTVSMRLCSGGVDGSDTPGLEGKQEGAADCLDEQIGETVCAHSHHFKFFNSTCWHSGGIRSKEPCKLKSKQATQSALAMSQRMAKSQ